MPEAESPDAVEADESAAVTVHGQPLEQIPDDLYIPPDALRVILEAFEGPLDLLLYLIRRQNLDILDIPVHRITRQYLEYINLMQVLNIELAGEYLLMATMLAEIKSRLLLPRPEAEEDEGDDPRAELVRRLQEYERFRQAAETLEELPRVGREIHIAESRPERVDIEVELPQPTVRELLTAFREVMLRAELFAEHRVQHEPLSVRERMGRILSALKAQREVAFIALFDVEEGRLGVVVTFLAILELAKAAMLTMSQDEPYAELRVRAAGPTDTTEVPELEYGYD